MMNLGNEKYLAKQLKKKSELDDTNSLKGILIRAVLSQIIVDTIEEMKSEKNEVDQQH